jgi:hypothetical protein
MTYPQFIDNFLGPTCRYETLKANITNFDLLYLTQPRQSHMPRSDTSLQSFEKHDSGVDLSNEEAPYASHKIVVNILMNTVHVDIRLMSQKRKIGS